MLNDGSELFECGCSTGSLLHNQYCSYGRVKNVKFTYHQILFDIFYVIGSVTYAVDKSITPLSTDLKHTEHVVTLSYESNNSVPQTIGPTVNSKIKDVVKRLNDERIMVDRELRENEQAEIRNFFNKEV